LLDSNGVVRARFGARIDPLDPSVIQMIESILPPEIPKTIPAA
jgi:hypothetical protein